MPLDKQSIREALARVPYPGAGMDIVSAGAVGKVAFCDGYASIRLSGGGLNDQQRAALVEHVDAAIRRSAQATGESLNDVHVEVTDDEPAVPTRPAAPPAPPPPTGHRPIGIPPPPPHSSPLPGVKHIVAVGAGKGGVGK